MDHGLPPQKDRLPRLMARARLVLLWERLWPVLWLPLGIIGGLIGLAWLDVLPLLPGWLHGVLVQGGLLAALIALGYGLSRLRLPDDAETRRRIEADSALPHRPLQSLGDRPAGDLTDPDTALLWQVHQARLIRLLPSLRIGLPDPAMTRRDPWGLRAIPILLLVLGLFVGWGSLGDRLRHGFSPDWGTMAAPAVQVQAWITPPAYTNGAPVMLTAGGGSATVPAGSKLLVLMQGGEGDGTLSVDGGRGIPFLRLGADSHRLELAPLSGSRLTVRLNGRTQADWTIQVLADEPPAIAFAEPPASDPQGRTRFDIHAQDDYGVAKAWVEILPVQRPADAEPLRVDLPLTPGREAASGSWHDLTSHRWAGLPVQAIPVTEDGAGQQGRGEPVTFDLPQRQFRHPIARALVELRQMLAADGETARPSVLHGLDALSGHPDLFGGDETAFLAMRVTGWRLLYDRSAEAVGSAMDLLWQTALRIEEGRTPDAQRALAEAAEALDKALAENAPQAVIEQLMAQLQAAMNDYLQALAESGQPLPPEALPPNADILNQSDLQDMLEQMRSLSETGAREAARQMLSQLQQMMQGLQMAPSSGAQQALDKLGQLAQQQRQLMQQGGPGAAEQQEGLRRDLGEAMRQMGESLGQIPAELGAAEQAMREAGKQLRQGQDAKGAQQQALDQLRQGMQAGQQMAQQQGGGLAVIPEGAQPSPGRDPLGRRLGTGLDDDSVKVPAKSNIQKSREVLDELRRRAGESQRPAAERDYLHRLLKQF